MTRPLFLKLCAAALLLAGVAFLIGTAMNTYHELTGEERPLSVEASDPIWLWAFIPFVAAVLLLMVALPGLHLAHADRAGVPGAVAHVLAVVGLALLAGLMAIMMLVPPSIADVAPEYLDADEPTGPLGIAFPVLWIGASVGFVALGLVHAWTGVVSRWGGIALAGGAVLGFVLEPVYYVGDLAMGVGVLMLGWGLLSHATAPPAAAPASMDLRADAAVARTP